MKTGKTSGAAAPAGFEITSAEAGAVLRLSFRGRLDVRTAAAIWRQAVEALDRVRPRRLVLDGSRLDACDGAGLALFVHLDRVQRLAGREVEVASFPDASRPLLDHFLNAAVEPPTGPARRARLIEDIGRSTVGVFRDLKAQVAFIGEVVVSGVQVLATPRSLRSRDAFLVAEKAGVNALPILALIGFLIGLILAFQSAIPLKQFAAEIFVANLVALSVVRELGPLMTAIVLAGRSASAFAAEIGTMKVGEEIDALTTMGLSPVRFLVLPRVIAATLVTPFLVIFTNLFALVGGAVVLLSLGFPLVTYVNQVTGALDAGDLLGGLVKALVFGLEISAIGCLRGLETGTGASAVGSSTTRSVVSSIVLVVITDGVFAVLYYCLGV